VTRKRIQNGDVLVFDPTKGKDELSLAEFPISSLSWRIDGNQDTLVFQDEIIDQANGENVIRTVNITAGKERGLPTAIDTDVLIVLIQLTKMVNDFCHRCFPSRKMTSSLSV